MMVKTVRLFAGLAAFLLMAGQSLAQVCNFNLPATTPDSRYTDHGDGTVTDESTGLMWKKCGEGLTGTDCKGGAIQSFSWQEALHQEEGSTFAGYSDWRLPNVKELATLVERRCVDPAINTTLFPRISNQYMRYVCPYWSSTPSAKDSLSYGFWRYTAWIVEFNTGRVEMNGYGNAAVRLVRGGE